MQHPTTPDKPLAGMKILVDAGNGAGGFFATEVLEPLGADTTGSQFLEPDGRFPNHIPNPEDAAAMAATIDAVIANKSDLGVVFDTDVDRCAPADRARARARALAFAFALAWATASGRAINKNRLIALMAAITLKEHGCCAGRASSMRAGGQSTRTASSRSWPPSR